MEKGTRASSSSRSPSRCHVAMGAPEGVGVSNIPPQVRRGTHGRVCQASGWLGSRVAPLIWWHGVIEPPAGLTNRSEEHTSELQSRFDLVCRLLLEKKNNKLEAFYDNPNAFRYYFRDIFLMVLAAEARNSNDSHADCYQYFFVPEYRTDNLRLLFHS